MKQELSVPISAGAMPVAMSSATSGAMRWRAGLVIITLLTFWPVTRAEFGGWDDEPNITRNAWLNPPTLAGVARYWRAPAYDLYVPLTWTAWAALAKIAYFPQGDSANVHLNPYIFHAANLTLHLFATLLVFEIVRRIARTNFAAACGTIVFAIHPIQVEAVAWVSGLKDVLGATLALAALLVYLRTTQPSKRLRAARIASATVLFALALLAKPSVIVLPAIAMIIDRWITRSAWRVIVTRAGLLIVVGVVGAIVAREFQQASFMVGAASIWNRPLIAGDAIAFYIRKIFWPVSLAVDYGRSPQHVLASSTIYSGAAIVFLIVIALMFKRARCVIQPACIFLIGISPMLGLLPFDFQAYSTVADHYVYLAMLGPAILFAFVATRFKWLALVVIPLHILSYQQAQTWHDAESIAQQTIRVNPDSFVWGNELALIRLRQDRPAEALELATRATIAQPKFERAWLTRGAAEGTLGDHGAAAESFRRAIEIDPTDSAAKLGLAGAQREIESATRPTAR